ncbi:MAG TPA: MAPEG family protein [Xanthobacteraceae bacterium]
MSIQTVLFPLFVEVVLTLVLGFWLSALRVDAVRSGKVHPRDIALREPNWPTRALQVGNAYHNELELPLLFYVLTILSIITRHADLLFVLLAWVFVVLRLVRAYIHVTDNNVPRRGMVFLAGTIVLAVMWAIFIVRILLGVP